VEHSLDASPAAVRAHEADRHRDADMVSAQIGEDRPGVGFGFGHCVSRRNRHDPNVRESVRPPRRRRERLDVVLIDNETARRRLVGNRPEPELSGSSARRQGDGERYTQRGTNEAAKTQSRHGRDNGGERPRVTERESLISV